MNEILEKYRIEFRMFHGLPDMNSINDWLSLFISDHYRVMDAERLLNLINAGLTDKQHKGEESYSTFTQSMRIAIVGQEETKIYEDMDEYENDKTIYPSFILPTVDLKIIVEAWKGYLIS